MDLCIHLCMHGGMCFICTCDYVSVFVCVLCAFMVIWTCTHKHIYTEHITIAP